MHPRSVSCPLCGGRFFKASLPIHLKTCEQKAEHVILACEYCGKEEHGPHMKIHLLNCSEARKEKQARCVSRGGSRSQQKSNSPQRRPRPKTPNTDTIVNTNDAPAVLDAQGRGMCNTCGRWFLALRLPRHSAACVDARPRRPVFDSAQQRLSDIADSSVQCMASPPHGRRKSQWRHAHRDLIIAVREARRSAAACRQSSSFTSFSPLGSPNKLRPLRSGSLRSSPQLSSPVVPERRRSGFRPTTPPPTRKLNGMSASLSPCGVHRKQYAFGSLSPVRNTGISDTRSPTRLPACF